MASNTPLTAAPASFLLRPACAATWSISSDLVIKNLRGGEYRVGAAREGDSLRAGAQFPLRSARRTLIQGARGPLRWRRRSWRLGRIEYTRAHVPRLHWSRPTAEESCGERCARLLRLDPSRRRHRWH